MRPLPVLLVLVGPRKSAIPRSRYPSRSRDDPSFEGSFYEGVTRNASKTASRLRSAVSRLRRALTSPTSATYQFLASWSSTCPPYSTMLAPCSAKVRATSSSSRGRSQDETAICTRKLRVGPPSQETFVNRSGLRRSDLTFEQSSRWIVIPLPSEMYPTILSPGTGVQHLASRTRTSSTPRTAIPRLSLEMACRALGALSG